MPSDCRYPANFLKVYSRPPSVRNSFTCLPKSISLRTFHSLNLSRASDWNFNMYSSVCLVASSMKSSMDQPPLIAVSRGLHMFECTRCRSSVAWEDVFGVMGFRANLYLIQHLHLHIPVIFGVSVTTFSKISKAFRPMCARQQCYNICFYVSCRDAWRVGICASRQLSLSILGYLVETGARSRTRSRTTSPLTWGAVALNLPGRL